MKRDERIRILHVAFTGILVMVVGFIIEIVGVETTLPGEALAVSMPLMIVGFCVAMVATIFYLARFIYANKKK